jgi:hypothetical protein
MIFILAFVRTEISHPRVFDRKARVGDERKVYKVLVGKPEGKRPL